MKWLIPLLIVVLGNAYVCRHLWMILPGSARAAGVSLCILFLLCIMAVFMWEKELPLWANKMIYTIGTAWIFIFLYLLMAFILLDFVQWIFPTTKTFFLHNWKGAATIGLFLILIFSYGRWHYGQKTRVSLDLTTDKPMTHPVKIVMVSDLHLGYTIGKKEMEQWADKINAEKPDVILIAGDIVDYSMRPLEKENIFTALHQLKAPLGVYACPGNHDVMAHAEEYAGFEQKSGIRLLKDETVLVDSTFYIIGRKDHSRMRRKPLKSLLEGIDKNKPIILLDHQPQHLEEAEQNSIDLQLSGHTHRGQVFPINLITDAIYEVSHGYKRKGKTHVYVSSGLGIWGGKFRIGSQSEYAVIDFHSKAGKK